MLTLILLRVVKHIQHNFKNKKSTGMILLDVEKAFDLVWHKGLLYEMQSLKFPTYLTKIIQSFLAHRSCYVKIGNEKSPIHDLPAGVVQGSTLRPALFNIYTSDLKLPNSECLLELYLRMILPYFPHIQNHHLL